MINDSPEITKKKPELELNTSTSGIIFKPKVEKSQSDLSSEGLKQSFEPKILAFCCNWCAYGGATTAGTLRIQYPPNIRIIRVMCSGRVVPHFILHAFERGADGVIVIGCYPNDCKYIFGFENCKKNIEMLQDYIDILGLNSARIKIESVNVTEGKKFVRIVTEFIDEIKKVGPNPIKIIEEK